MISRAPMNRAERIDLSRAPSSMEQLAAGWAHRQDQDERRRAPARPESLRTMLARGWDRLEAHRAELERGI